MEEVSIWYPIIGIPLGLAIIAWGCFFLEIGFDKEVVTEEDVEEELAKWRALTAPLDKIIEEHKYFCEHSKFPDPPPTGSILFTDKCPAPLSYAERRANSPRSHYDGMNGLKVTDGARRGDLGDYLEAQWKEEVRTTNCNGSLKGQFSCYEDPCTMSVVFKYVEDGKELTKVMSQEAIEDHTRSY